jgi:hypothetical protein
MGSCATRYSSPTEVVRPDLRGYLAIGALLLVVKAVQISR